MCVRAAFRMTLVARVDGFSLASCVVAILHSACLGGSGVRPVNINVRPDTVLIARTSDRISMKLTSVIRSNAENTLFYQPCGAYLERLVEGTWATVWTPTCLGAGPPTPIEPHDSATIDIDVLAFPARGSDGTVRLPIADSRLAPGQYRVIVPIGRSAAASGIGIDHSLPLAQRASHPFEIR